MYFVSCWGKKCCLVKAALRLSFRMRVLANGRVCFLCVVELAGVVVFNWIILYNTCELNISLPIWLLHTVSMLSSFHKIHAVIYNFIFSLTWFAICPLVAVQTKMSYVKCP